METTTFDDDIRVMYVTATSFPDGIMDANHRLHARVPFTEDRKYFGISRHEEGIIVYYAAAEEKSLGEAESLQCDTLVLKQGTYASIMIYDFMLDIPAINKAFEVLLSRPDVDPEEYCVELFTSDNDVKCMVRLKDDSKSSIPRKNSS